ncbi:MAG: 1-acyl-sn-glycerol-3-phosphate acyltransferase [Crocinitomicaceae bacterium]|nr:lysophospholipid acyltransferase family protein [Flavobacteriales bacterium]NQZ38207.1 1-acyl-sn-glycerol-3-phosphate acyltransferase [Crocinitomicaceae bacterium]
MLYSILKRIIGMSLHLFFRRIDVIGVENIPENGPIIFVSNHPSALMDPLTIAVILKRKIHFLAASEYFGKGLKARVLKNQLNMIPVHRPWLSKKKEVSNVEMFEECYQSLNQDKCIIIFPEASSSTVSKIRELKTGAVRIKAGFEKYTDQKKMVPIIPIGLSYSNPHEFQSRVVVKIGEPILFSPSENDEDLPDLYRSQTNQVQEELKKTIIHIDNTQNEDLVKSICRLFIATHREEKAISGRDKKGDFEFYQSVASAVAHFEETNSAAYTEMSTRIETYFDAINQLGISDDLLEEAEGSKPSVFKWIFMVLGSLIALPSLFVFFTPYQLTKLIFRKKIKSAIEVGSDGGKYHYAFTGTLIFVVGMLLFGIWTPIIGVSVYFISSSWLIALVSMVLLYPMMRFSMHYAKVGLRLLSYYKGRRIKKMQKERVSFYVSERTRIVQELKKYQISYAEMNGAE